jgi:hypothetical protein
VASKCSLSFDAIINASINSTLDTTTFFISSKYSLNDSEVFTRKAILVTSIAGLVGSLRK